MAHNIKIEVIGAAGVIEQTIYMLEWPTRDAAEVVAAAKAIYPEANAEDKRIRATVQPWRAEFLRANHRPGDLVMEGA